LRNVSHGGGGNRTRVAPPLPTIHKRSQTYSASGSLISYCREITTAQFEQLSGFLDAERLGRTDRVCKPETARRRRALAKTLGVSPADAETEPLT
jgi:hypothetical protein